LVRQQQSGVIHLAANLAAVWFIYPETANIRLEDMNSLFGDATSVMPTPATLAEAESLFSRSPVPSLDIRTSRHGAEDAIPGLDIDPPDLDDQTAKSTPGEGIGGWISNMVNRGKGNGEGESGRYKQVGQDED
jgi:hypothetical protein